MPYSDPEQRRAYGREWIRLNAERARAAMQRWRERHPEDHRAEGRAYYARHRERIGAAIAEYHRTHPEVVKAKGHAYRARKRASPGSFTHDEWLGLVAAYQGRCAYCRKRRVLEAEHRIPLSRGGTNFISNILPACHPCNAEKHRRTEDEYRQRLEREGRR